MLKKEKKKQSGSKTFTKQPNTLKKGSTTPKKISKTSTQSKYRGKK
jgi:hypothetical protein